MLLGNLVGSVFYGLLLAGALTMSGQVPLDAVAKKIARHFRGEDHRLRALRRRRAAHRLCKGDPLQLDGVHGVVMGMASSSVAWKDPRRVAADLHLLPPGLRALDREHVRHPGRDDARAKVTMADWWLWNEIPVTLGNVVGGLLFTGMAMYLTHAPHRGSAAAPQPVALPLDAEPTV